MLDVEYLHQICWFRECSPKRYCFCDE